MCDKSFLLKLTLLCCVVDVLNGDTLNITETENKLPGLNKQIRNILDSFITYVDTETDEKNKKLPEFEEKITQTLYASIKNLEEKITQNVNASIIRTEEIFEDKIAQTLNSTNNNIIALEEKIIQLLQTSNKKTEYTLVEMKKELLEKYRYVDCGKLPPLPHGSAELLNGTTHLGSVVQYSCATNYRLVGPARRTCAEDFQWSETAPSCEGLCKEQSIDFVGYDSWYSLDDVSRNHYGTLEKNSTGHRTNIALHFAVQAEGAVGITLSEKKDYYSGIRWVLFVGEGWNQRTGLYYNDALVQQISTPDIHSSTQLRSFFIKIDDGKLQFGKEGETPLISYSGIDLSSLNYYRFYLNGGKIRYCTAVAEGSS